MIDFVDVQISNVISFVDHHVNGNKSMYPRRETVTSAMRSRSIAYERWVSVNSCRDTGSAHIHLTRLKSFSHNTNTSMSTKLLKKFYYFIAAGELSFFYLSLACATHTLTPLQKCMTALGPKYVNEIIFIFIKRNFEMWPMPPSSREEHRA